MKPLEGEKNRKQKVDIYFNFVGQVEIPKPDENDMQKGKSHETRTY